MKENFYLKVLGTLAAACLVLAAVAALIGNMLGDPYASSDGGVWAFVLAGLLWPIGVGALLLWLGVKALLDGLES